MIRRYFHYPKFARDISGAALVEFALIAVPIFIVIFGTVQNVLFSVARISLDSNLQALVYAAANNGSSMPTQFFNRPALCAQAGVYLVACSNSPDLCFSVVQLDTIMANNLAKLPCTGNVNLNSINTGPVAIIVEYRVPNYFAFFGALATSDVSLSPSTTIRSVALYHPGL